MELDQILLQYLVAQPLAEITERSHCSIDSTKFRVILASMLFHAYKIQV